MTSLDWTTIGFALEHLDGFGSVLSTIPAERWAAIDPVLGISGESEARFWGFLVGGLFLYMPYYRADQSQVQRKLSTLLAASMSSLDSALNSLSAATMRDFVEHGRNLQERRILFLSKVTTVRPFASTLCPAAGSSSRSVCGGRPIPA